MRAYFINLDKRPQRRAAMEARFEGLGIAHVRVAAHTPADVTDDQRRLFCNPRAYRWQSEGELACSLSHVAALQEFLVTGELFAAIFEDDAILSRSLRDFLRIFEQQRPPIDILRIETDNSRMRLAPRPVLQLDGYAVHKLYAAGGGAAAYIVSRRAAQRIVGGDELLANLTDQALFNPHAPLSRDLVVLQLVPALAMQEDRAPNVDRLQTSDLEPLRHDRCRRDGQNFWRRSAYNFYDLVERDIIDAVRKQWNKHRHGVVKRELPFKAD
jgi:glycosyl transferase, family 25